MKQIQEVENMELMQLLKCASTGLSYMISKENEINERTRAELGRENGISLHRIDKYEEEFAAIYDLIGKIENGTISNNVIE